MSDARRQLLADPAVVAAIEAAARKAPAATEAQCELLRRLRFPTSTRATEQAAS